MNRVRFDRIDPYSMREFAMFCAARHGELSFEEAEHLRASLAQARNIPANTEVIREGACLDKPQLLLQGWAVRQHILKDGRRQILSFILPGDVYGLCGRRDGVALCSTASLTAVTVAPVPKLSAVLYQEHQTALARFAHDQLSQEDTLLCNQVVRLGRQASHERLISLLLELYFRLKQVNLAQDHSFNLPLTQEALSDALGISVVHTNRTLQQLKRENLVTSKGISIALSDLARLSEMSDFRPGSSSLVR